VKVSVFVLLLSWGVIVLPGNYGVYRIVPFHLSFAQSFMMRSASERHEWKDVKNRQESQKMIIECTKGKRHDKKDEKGFIWGCA